MSNGTKAFNTLLGAAVNSTFQAIEDGRINGNDIAFYLDDIGLAKPGIEGLKEFKDEAQTMTVAENEAVKAGLNGQMSALPELDRYYLVNGLHGLQAIARYLFLIGYRKGQEDGEAKARAAISNSPAAKK